MGCLFVVLMGCPSLVLIGSEKILNFFDVRANSSMALPPLFVAIILAQKKPMGRGGGFNYYSAVVCKKLNATVLSKSNQSPKINGVFNFFQPIFVGST